MVWQRRWWWTASNPDEVVGEIDLPTYYRARTREAAIAKCVRANSPRGPQAEIIVAKGGDE